MNNFDIRIMPEKRGFRLADDIQYYTDLLDFETAAVVHDGLEIINDFQEVSSYIKWALAEYSRYRKNSHHRFFDLKMTIAEKCCIVQTAAFARLSGLRPIVSKWGERWVPV